MSSIIIGICILAAIILVTAVAALVIGLCLWRHYTGFHKGKYSKQENPENRNGSMLREINPSISGPYYQAIPTHYTEDTPQSIALEGFKRQMDVLWSNDCKLLTSEYTSLGQSELRYPTEAAREHISDGKNRYKNIYPYDKSRVHLLQRVEGSDYVNASHIPGIHVSETFIASQAPKKETMLEFWEMLWQKRVSNVVMLTKFMEGNKKKCEPYLPERAGETIGVGDLLITLHKVTSEYDQTTRHLEVKNRRDITTVIRMRHFHFSGWPDHEAPRFPQGLLNFIMRVKRDRVQDNSPICTHCSAGVGRSGAFIALYNLIEEIKKCLPFSIHRVVNEMREHRPHMVQTFTQYKFIYLSCLELIHGDSVIPANGFGYMYTNCLEVSPSIIQAQLEEIDYCAEKAFSRSYSEALSNRNQSYNPDTSVLPFDDYRPMLSTPAWGVGGYINASYVDGFQGFQDFIATQHPNVFTARHTIQLIFQTECPLVVVLTSPEEFAQMGYEQGRIIYWPEPTTQHEFDGFVLKNVSQLHGEIMEFLLIDTSDNSQHRFHLIISLHWSASGAAVDTHSVLGIVNEIISVKANFPTKPIIVHCEDGAGKSGVLLAVYNAITQLTEEGQVDIFQIVKCMRYCRDRMVHSTVSLMVIISTSCQTQQPLIINIFIVGSIQICSFSD